ncbi:hypothetical protein D9619_010096 [Psilocybe cf. subviscida]|uniref:Amine oxidase domain-containing protein n=1 Tax=Psilocybe cf. subviscida TaxID=2480587 RepID=A0A8H5BKG3_9AGAR|nr:hypothetical protein D9619_010096 [Psilocybe cf. subviscida]
MEPGTVFKPILRERNSFSKHEVSYRDFAAFFVVEQAIQTSLEWAKRNKSLPTDTPGPVIVSQLPESVKEIKVDKIGIVGAGVAGLYAAMILQSLNIDYEILEANDRIGGRVFTHRFNGDKGVDAPVNDPARYDYFDVGAMRFPDIPFMDRVKDLFGRLGLEDRLIDYKFSAPNNLLRFNTILVNPSSITLEARPDDPFKVSVSQGGAVPDHFVKGLDSVDHWTGKVWNSWKGLFARLNDNTLPPADRRKIFQEAWSTLRQKDHLSTRTVMSEGQATVTDNDGKVLMGCVQPYPNRVIDWLETFATGTGGFNSSFVESVMDSLDFDWPFPYAESLFWAKDSESTQTWKAIDGGSDHIPRRMVEGLKVKPILHKQVVKLVDTGKDIEVTVAGEQEPRIYSQVISTVTLGCLSGIDVEKCGLSYSQKLAVRSLQMMASTKIGIKFKTRWWQDPDVMGKDTTIMGGQSSTDIPIRCCVYPSYGLDCKDAPGVLLASYSWSQDALRLGALASGPKEDQQELLRLTLNNLSKLHNISEKWLSESVVDFFAHNFYTDPYARGAFAEFGPGQFGHDGDRYSLFASLKAPAAQGKFHIAGEATSAHHAWVLGGLNSAWRAVYNSLHGDPERQEELVDKWGIPDEENTDHLGALYDLGIEGCL